MATAALFAALSERLSRLEPVAQIRGSQGCRRPEPRGTVEQWFQPCPREEGRGARASGLLPRQVLNGDARAERGLSCTESCSASLIRKGRGSPHVSSQMRDTRSGRIRRQIQPAT